ncbi:zinc finger protein 420 isoform X2 [Dermacentor silvarum]|uniref:zinc finger protein 420 isoform X2 n=1 Tax=Dermacentor silvarum TaxID=543639 RepID=UPI0018985533|nr:zinc finger protein 420 isoform X2 [Dermacentor silvarum]
MPSLKGSHKGITESEKSLLMEKLQQQQGNDPPGSGEEEHPCPCCERVFPTAERLAVHVKVHRGGPKRPLKCKECCRTFPRIDKLRAHQVVHRVGKPYQCELCGKAFTFKQTLMEHLLRHTGERRHQCDLCPQSFYFRADLTSHRRRHSGLPASSGAPPLGSHRRWQLLQCNFCPFVSRFESAIRRHQLRHTKERPHRCEFCPKSFQRRYQLTQHMTIRHGTKPLPVPRQKMQDFSGHMAPLDPVDNSSQFPVDMAADLFPF